MLKIATYTMEGNRKIFSSEINAVEMVKNGKPSYVKISNSTFTLPKVQANENQILVLQNEGTDNEAWILEDKVLKGVFYEKQGGKMVSEIFVRDSAMFTEVPPLEFYDDETTQIFNEALQEFEYNNRGSVLLEKELAEQLESAKKERLTQLQNDYNTSKKIIIQNGNTLIIEHNTPERSIFLHKLTFMLKEGLLNNVAISYQQNVNNVMYRFSALPTIWNYVFKDLFLVDRRKSDGTLTGFKESSREHNKILFDLLLLQIQNTTTQQELDSISWEFVNPNGTVINVNNKAGQMLNDASVDDFTKSAINQLKDPTTGDIHLIQIIPLFDKNIQTQNNEETPPSRQTSDEEEVGKEFSMS
jgi:hypothetical protein